jgi:hypothetical protein
LKFFMFIPISFLASCSFNAQQFEVILSPLKHDA